jgi:hypothetical protein
MGCRRAEGRRLCEPPSDRCNHRFDDLFGETSHGPIWRDRCEHEVARACSDELDEGVSCHVRKDLVVDEIRLTGLDAEAQRIAIDGHDSLLTRSR